MASKRRLRRNGVVSKAIAERKHAKKRAKQRYGIDFTKDLRKRAEYEIQHGLAIFLEKQSNRVSKFLVSIGNVSAVACYDKIRHTIITFLPPESLLEFK